MKRLFFTIASVMLFSLGLFVQPLSAQNIAPRGANHFQEGRAGSASERRHSHGGKHHHHRHHRHHRHARG